MALWWLYAGAKSLSFPSFATSLLGMQPKLAVSIIREVVDKFLSSQKDAEIRLVLTLEGKDDPVYPFLQVVYLFLATFFPCLLPTSIHACFLSGLSL